MGIFDKFKTSTAIDRLSEEKLYEQVAQELKAGKKREGIWVKAMAKSDGDLNKAESMYIELRVQAIKDEAIVNVELEDRAKAIATKARIDKESSDRVTREKEKEEKEEDEIEAKIEKCEDCIEGIESKGYTVEPVTEDWRNDNNISTWNFHIYKEGVLIRSLWYGQLCRYSHMSNEAIEKTSNVRRESNPGDGIEKPISILSIVIWTGIAIVLANAFF